MTADVNVVIDHSEYTILVVDDVVSNVLLLKVLLTNEKFKVVTANNGKDALVQAAEKQPDLILLDVMMPEMNGFEVSEKLKANPVTQNIPIIFLTALNTTSDIVKGFKVGANDFISKPFNKEELVIRVTHQISLVAAKRIILRQTEELRKTIMGRDKLYSVIAHDLRSPMGSIKMVLNMLILSLPPSQIGEEMYQMLSMANQSTEDVFALLDNLLKWTKSQIGKLNVVYQDFNIVENIASVIEIFNLVAGIKNIKLRYLGDDKIEVHAGIDLGTTNSLAAVWRNGQSELIPNALGKFLTPSVVCVDEDGMVLTGEAARDLQLIKPQNCASNFKRMMGTSKTLKLGGREFRAEELSASEPVSIVPKPPRPKDKPSIIPERPQRRRR